ncbi:hypothetical protein Tco_1410084 [Tanacetum coccineum]
MPRKKFHVLAQHLQEVMEESLPKMVDARVQELTKTQVPIYVAYGLIMERQQNQADVAKMIAYAIQQDRENLQAEISSAKMQKTSEHGTYVFRDFSSGKVNESEPGPSTSGNQEQLDNPDFWTDSYATDDDELPTEKVSQELVEEIKEILVSPYLQNPTPVIQSCQRDPKAPALSLLGVERYQQKVNLTAPTIIFLGIKKYKVFSIVSKPVYGIIYKNNKKEKRVMRHQEIHKFCDATLKRVLEGLKIYNNNVKHGYVTLSLSKEDAEYLQLFEEGIEECLKHHDQMRH